MSWPQFVFVDVLPPGPSKHLRKLRQRHIQSHAAAGSARRIDKKSLSGAACAVASVQAPQDVLAATDVPENEASASSVSRLQTSTAGGNYPDRSLNPSRVPKSTYEEEYGHKQPLSGNSAIAAGVKATHSSPEPAAGLLGINREQYSAIPSDHHGFGNDPFN